MEAMNASNRCLFQRSYKEVLEDYDDVKGRVARARDEKNSNEEELFNNLLKNLGAELQSFL
jgi:hypothetical protein